MKNLKKSLKCHVRSSDFYHYNLICIDGKEPKYFWFRVKRDYHDNVHDKQFNEKRVLSRKEKKDIYDFVARTTASKLMTVNESNPRHFYIPKKYNK